MRPSLLLAFLFVTIGVAAQPLPPGAPAVVITEILYNLPGTDQALEFIEVTNPSMNERGLSGYRFVEGVEYSFPTGLIAQPHQFFIVAKDSVAFENAFGIPAFQWDAGELDAGQRVILRDNFNQVADSLTYSNVAPWPVVAPGTSIVMCNDTADASNPVNWSAATNNTGIILNGTTLFANPGEPCSVDNAIAEDLTNVLRLYPNPTQGGFWIETANAHEQLNLEIVSMTGQVVHSQVVDSDTWIQTDLPDGIYVARAVHRHGLYTQRFIITR